MCLERLNHLSSRAANQISWALHEFFIKTSKIVVGRAKSSFSSPNSVSQNQDLNQSSENSKLESDQEKEYSFTKNSASLQAENDFPIIIDAEFPASGSGDFMGYNCTFHLIQTY